MDFSHIKSAALSDIGHKRKANEDAILVLPAAGIFCVADGMGGAAGGELASRWTVEEIQRAFPTSAESSQKTEQVRQALNEASRRIKAMADEQSIVGAGTTAVVLFFDDYQPDQATILHAGDSRAYRIRDGLMECLTEDHSLAASAGLAHDDVLPSMFRGVITRAIGLDNTVELDESVIQVKAGDCYMLCSDGLTKMLADSDIQNLIFKTSPLDPHRLAATLVDEANHAGGDDNISVVLVCVGKLPARKQRPDASENFNIVDVTETVELVVPAAGTVKSGQTPTPSSTAASSELNRPWETEDIIVGATPQSGHGSTINTPPPPGNIPVTVPGKRQPSLANNQPTAAQTAFKPGRRRLLFLALIIIALAAAYYISGHYQNRLITSQAPAGPGPAATNASPAPTDSSGFLAQMSGSDQEAIWQMERTRAVQNPAYPVASLGQYRDVIATLCATLNLPPPAPALPTPGSQTAEQRAEDYCIQLFDLQQHLRTQVAEFVNDRADELSLFGELPPTVLETLRQFSGQPAQPATEKGPPFESLRHDLKLVANWLEEDRQRLIPLDEIHSGPPSLLPRILTERNEVWTGVLAEIAACGPAIEQRQLPDTGDALLNNIAALQRVIMKRAQASRTQSDVIPWPGKNNLPTLDGFFKRVGQYLDREQGPVQAPADTQ